MFERGRPDHLGFTVRDGAAITALRDPLLAVDATSGIGRRLGPMLSLRFVDPGRAKGEVNCLYPSFDPTSLRDEDEIVDPCWFEHTRRVLRSGR